MTTGASR